MHIWRLLVTVRFS